MLLTHVGLVFKLCILMPNMLDDAESCNNHAMLDL